MVRAARMVQAAALALAAHAAIAAPATPAVANARIFVPVPHPDALDPAWRTTLCARLPAPCDPDGLQLLRERGSAPSSPTYVVTSTTPLAWATVAATPATPWSVTALSDLRAHATGDDDRLTFHLAPVLYPLGGGRWAVAVVKGLTDMYSGGGASFEQASFVALDAPADAAPVHADIPFSCSKLVRACFSSEEYARAEARGDDRCHDESDGSLRIRYHAGADAGAAYRWSFVWVQSDQNADEPKPRVTRRAFDAASRDTAAWCGGPM